MSFFKSSGVSFVCFCGFTVLMAAFLTVNCEVHSLTYIYTALSKPVDGLHQFTAEGLLDGHSIDYFDSDSLQKVPRPTWMKESLPQSYWDKGTESRRSKQQWFNVNLGILKERMRHNDTDLHTLQWLHGCEATMLNGNLSVKRTMDTYSYDGENFLSFDDDHQTWTAGNPAARETVRKWELVSTLKDYTRSYLKTECLKWMKDFMGYRQEHLNQASPPEVVMFATPSTVSTNVHLTCLATGFYFKDVELRLSRDGRVLKEVNKVISSGVRPNHDDTFQKRDTVEILKSDTAEFTCQLVHKPSGLQVQHVWDHTLPPESPLIPIIVGVLLSLFVVVVVVVLVVLYKKQKIGCPSKRDGKGSKESLNSSGSSKSDPTDDNKSEENKQLMEPQTKGSEGSLSSQDLGVSIVIDDNKSEEIKPLMEPQTKGSEGSLTSLDSGVSSSNETGGENKKENNEMV